jgi:hypothetical protein
MVVVIKRLPLLQVHHLKVLTLRCSLFELLLMEAGLRERLWRILLARLRLVGRTKDRSGTDAA